MPGKRRQKRQGIEWRKGESWFARTLKLEAPGENQERKPRITKESAILTKGFRAPKTTWV